MKDIQNERDYRKIAINKVGIKDLRYPVTVLDRNRGKQHTVASINMYVDLPHEYKGTHMSRFVEILHLLRPEISLQGIADVLAQTDAYVGEILDAIDALGIRDNTVFVFTADNGPEGAIPHQGFSGPWRGSCRSRPAEFARREACRNAGRCYPNLPPASW